MKFFEESVLKARGSLEIADEDIHRIGKNRNAPTLDLANARQSSAGSWALLALALAIAQLNETIKTQTRKKKRRAKKAPGKPF